MNVLAIHRKSLRLLLKKFLLLMIRVKTKRSLNTLKITFCFIFFSNYYVSKIGKYVIAYDYGDCLTICT